MHMTRDLGEQVFAGLAAGAEAYCVSSAHIDRLLQAVQLVAARGMYLDLPVAERVLRAVRQFVTPEEHRVLHLLAEGQTAREIVLSLRVSQDCVTNPLWGAFVNFRTAVLTQNAVPNFRPHL